MDLVLPELALSIWVAEILFGWPSWVHERIRHPVVWIGALVNRLDDAWNRPHDTIDQRRRAGLLCTLVVIGATVLVAMLISQALPDTLPGYAIEALVGSSLLASRSLDKHVRAVAIPLAAGNLASARVAVACIVGRDCTTLDEQGISRAALESLAENASDGVVAPLFWCVLLGLPGLAAYKAINTLDSMIGHRTSRHEEFGRFSARLDDLVNLVPARITAALMIVAGGIRAQPGAVMREARLHRSPNAGWPESAAARTLGVRLSGPREYAGVRANEPWLNPQGRDPEHSDLLAGLWLYRRALLFGVLVLAAVACV